MTTPVIPSCKPADQGRRCNPATITYTDQGARCSGCGAFWPLHRSDKGQLVGYLTPPTTRRAAS